MASVVFYSLMTLACLVCAVTTGWMLAFRRRRFTTSKGGSGRYVSVFGRMVAPPLVGVVVLLSTTFGVWSAYRIHQAYLGFHRLPGASLAHCTDLLDIGELDHEAEVGIVLFTIDQGSYEDAIFYCGDTHQRIAIDIQGRLGPIVGGVLPTGSVLLSELRSTVNNGSVTTYHTNRLGREFVVDPGKLTYLGHLFPATSSWDNDVALARQDVRAILDQWKVAGRLVIVDSGS